MKNRVVLFALAGCLLLGFVGAVTLPASRADASAPETPSPAAVPLGPSPDWVIRLPEAETASQLLLVANYEGSASWISLHQRDAAGEWQMLLSTPGFTGREGLGKEREGDLRTPRGSFGLNAAFGLAPDPGCAIPYTQVDDTMYWSSDRRPGMHYNELVRLADCPGLDLAACEHLADCRLEYQYCLSIDYNRDCVPGKGSAIFLHCFGERKPFTSGCVAIPTEQMQRMMQLVQPDCAVRIDSLDALGGGF